MIYKQKQFCLNGHDTFVTGRDKSNGECTQCRCERKRIDPNKDTRKKDFCKNGHNMAIVGRINHMCEICRRDYEKQYTKDNADKIKAYKEIYLKEHEDKIKKQAKEYRDSHKDQIYVYQKEYQVKNRMRKRAYWTLKRYDITVEYFEQMFEKQKGCCLGCGIHQDDLKKSLNIDHDHSTGKVRGLLCNPCNLLLGKIEKDIKVTRRLIRYILKNK